MTKFELTRRNLLRGTAVLGGGALIGAQPFGLIATSLATETGKGLEAPSLAARVAAGELPPVAERLPKVALLIEPNAAEGAYGGSWKYVLPSWDYSFSLGSVGYEPLVRWKEDTEGFRADELTANVAESFSTNGNLTEFTFKLREGMKWSDGAAFSADDIMFAINDLYLNADLYPTPPKELVSGGQPVVAEKLGDYEIVLRFAAPNPLFLNRVAQSNGSLVELTNSPKHYLSAFHGAHSADAAQAAEDQNLSGWPELFLRQSAIFENIDLPRLHAWLPMASYKETAGVTFVRNPYYWKVDPEGSQLPYLDEVRIDYMNPDVMVLRASEGNVDVLDVIVNTVENKPVFAQNREMGNYEFATMLQRDFNLLCINFNLTHKDPFLRGIFQNKQFRIAMSHAINRTELIATVYRSQGEPWQVGPLPGTPGFNEGLVTQYLEFDPDLANQLLDESGYSERDGDGIRLGEGGRPISFFVDVSVEKTEILDALELVKLYWRNVGIGLDVRAVDGSLLRDMRIANEHNIWMGLGNEGGRDPHVNPALFMPYNNDSPFAIPWAQWYASGGSQGEEPPADVKAQMSIYDQIRAATSNEELESLMFDFLEVAREQFYAIGIGRPFDGYAIVNNDFKNVPETFMRLAFTKPEQFFVSGD